MSDESSTHSLIAILSLCSYKVLAELRKLPLRQPLPDGVLREATYLSYLPWASRLPDHVFESCWIRIREAGQSASFSSGRYTSWSQHALASLAEEHLDPKHGKIEVKLSKFGIWQQSVLSRMSGLPIRAAAASIARYGDNVSNEIAFLAQDQLGSEEYNSWNCPVLLSPREPLIEDYIDREGLNETHLHLNGSTHAEVCWLRALLNPKAETRDFDRQWKNLTNPNAAKTRELARAIDPNLNPAELYNHLIISRNLRAWLVSYARGDINNDSLLPLTFEDLRVNCPQAPVGEDDSFKLSNKSSVEDEISWMTALLKNLSSRPSVTFDRMFHLYLLLQSQYYRLLVQSEEQSGFDQFQKLTFTELREPIEKQYFDRFIAMHGPNPNKSRTRYLEGRFSPKSTLRKNYELLKTILFGYWQYLNHSTTKPHREFDQPKSLAALLDQLDLSISKQVDNRSRHKLTLVAHFIKQPWESTDPNKAGPYRFYSLRKDVEEKSNILLSMFKRWPKLHTWVRGIDAAANELHAPPEVFASCYRICQRAGISRRTYHVGEDFPHLLTGIAQILDSLELLNLRDGDRIGHGTAMGISPKLWLDRMPSRLFLKAGDWMISLLATWRLLRRLPDAVNEAYRVECDLAELASKIFGSDINCARLARAMELRRLDARYVMASRDPKWTWQQASTNEFWRAEAQIVADYCQQRQDDLALLWDWLSNTKIWERSERMIPVEAEYLTSELYLRLQQEIMSEIAERKVVVETLPSSNVRISLYNDFKEHHSLRWMRVPGYVEHSDPEIMVSLGSDDPGIFAGDLNGEFYQLYAVLRQLGNGDTTSIKYIEPVNERGRQYRFHHPSLK